MLNEQYSSYISANTSYIWWDDDDVHFVLDQHAELDFYSASSLTQQSAGRHVAPLETHYPDSEPTDFYSYSLMLSGEAAITNCIVIGLTRTGLASTIYCSWSKHTNNYTTDGLMYL
jgi:hypothetical protein